MSALISLADAKALYLNIGVSDTAKDTAVTAHILWASAEIERYCNQPILQTTYTGERFDGNGCERWIFPHTLPVSGISALQYLPYFGGDWETVDTATYETLTGRGVTMLYKPTGFVQGVQNYRVTYTVGYALANVPDAIRRVVCEMVQRLLAESRHGETQLAQEMVLANLDGVGNATTKFIDLNSRWRRTLSKYRLLVV